MLDVTVSIRKPKRSEDAKAKRTEDSLDRSQGTQLQISGLLIVVNSL